MPCLANLWEYKFFIFYGGLAVFALLGILIALAPGVKRRWLKNALAIVGALVAGPAVFVFVVAGGLSILVWLSNPGPQYRSVESPDGAHTATVKYQAGFLGEMLLMCGSQRRDGASTTELSLITARAGRMRRK